MNMSSGGAYLRMRKNKNSATLLISATDVTGSLGKMSPMQRLSLTHTSRLSLMTDMNENQLHVPYTLDMTNKN